MEADFKQQLLLCVELPELISNCLSVYRMLQHMLLHTCLALQKKKTKLNPKLEAQSATLYLHRVRERLELF